MKFTLSGLVMPLTITLFIATGCNKTKDLGNKTTITVSCVRNNTDPNAGELGSEITISRLEGGERRSAFTLVPATVTFKELAPGTYQVSGQNANSTTAEFVQVQKDAEQNITLKFD